MSTTKISLSSTAWVLVSTASKGTMQNQTNQIVKYRTDTALPSSSVTVGHNLGRDKSQTWSFEPAQNIYARLANEGSGDLIVTEG